MNRIFFTAVACIALSLTAGCNKGEKKSENEMSPSTQSTQSKVKKPKFAFITNCEDPFWKISEKGVLAAARDLNIEAVYREPKQFDANFQREIIEDMLTVGVDGIAISPIDPVNQKSILNKMGEKTLYICQDSDAPDTNRLVFIGVDNYKAGRKCGELIKKAIPDGGQILITVGNLDQLNARQRRQGIVDEVFSRSYDPARYDVPGKQIKEGDKYTVLDTITDSGNRTEALSKAEDAILRYPDLKCMVGLFAYNPPACLKAIKNSNKLDKIKVVAFDEDYTTLQGIVDGDVFGTVVQDPFNYGYQSMKILNELKKGNKSLIPETKYIEIPERAITKENVEEYWKLLKEQQK